MKYYGHQRTNMGNEDRTDMLLSEGLEGIVRDLQHWLDQLTDQSITAFEAIKMESGQIGLKIEFNGVPEGRVGFGETWVEALRDALERMTEGIDVECEPPQPEE